MRRCSVCVKVVTVEPLFQEHNGTERLNGLVIAGYIVICTEKQRSRTGQIEGGQGLQSNVQTGEHIPY